jgi:hypothetical protein
MMFSEKGSTNMVTDQEKPQPVSPTDTFTESSQEDMHKKDIQSAGLLGVVSRYLLEFGVEIHG